jgi:2-isopropylmalate synthase
MRAEDVGFTGANLVLGKHSGRHAFRDRVVQLGYALDDKVFEQVFNDFIALADKKKDVYDSDIVAIIENRIGDAAAPDQWKLISFHTSAGMGTVPTATMQLQQGDSPVRCDAATGDGPVDAVFRALQRITGIQAELKNYTVRSLSVGQEAQGEALVEIAAKNRTHHGKAVSTDIIEASALAYLRALNKAAAAHALPQPPMHPQHSS